MQRDCVIRLINKRSICLVLFFIANSSLAQVEKQGYPLEESTELEMESVVDYEEVHQRFKSKISIKEFINDPNIYLLFINENQRKQIQQHITETGSIKDLLELQTLSSISFHDYQKLLTVLYIEENGNGLAHKTSIRYQNRWNYQTKNNNQNYPNTWGHYESIKINFKKIKMGLAREFDIGEASYSSYLIGKYDHFSSFINYQHKNLELNLGNYQVFQGLGLLVGQGYNNSFGNGGIQNTIQQRWLGTANQTEYNTFKGVYLKNSIAKMVYSFAYSQQYTDSGTKTGYHRTLNERSKMKTIAEKEIIIGLSNFKRKYTQHVLLLNEIHSKTFGLSYALQYFWRNTVSFTEISGYESRIAYTIGTYAIFQKQIQLSLAYTRYEKGYESPWMYKTVQTISLAKEKGLVMSLSIPLKHQINLQYSYRFSINENKNLSGQSSYTNHNIRVDKAFHKQLNTSLNVLLQYNTHNGKNEEENYFTEYLLRSRLVIQIKNNEQFQQEYHAYLSSNFNVYSKSIVYQLKFKNKKSKFLYSLAYYDVPSKVELYLTFSDIIRNRNTQAVYSTGMRQSIGIEYKLLKKIHLSTSILSVHDDPKPMYKLVCNLNYP